MSQIQDKPYHATEILGNDCVLLIIMAGGVEKKEKI